MAENQNDAVIKELETKIRELKDTEKNFIDIDAQNAEFEEEIARLKVLHQKRIDDLNDKHNKAIKSLEDKVTEAKQKIEQLDEKAKFVSESYKAEISDLENKITTLKQKKISVYSKGIKEAENKTKTKKSLLNENLNDLLAEQKRITDEYNEKIIILNNKYQPLKDTEEKLQNSLNEKLKGIVVENEALLKDLNDTKERIIKKHNDEINNLKKHNEEIQTNLTVKQDVTYSFLNDHLNNANARLNDANALREAKLKEIEEENQKANTEFEELKAKHDQKIYAAKTEIDELKATLANKKDQLAKTIEETNASIAAKKAEYNSYVEGVGAEENRLANELQEKLNQKDEKFKQKFSNLIDGYDNKYNLEVKRFAQEIEALKADLDKEKDNLNKLQEINKKRYQDKENDYKKLIASLRDDNEKTSEKTSELIADYNTRISNLKNELQDIQQKNKAEIADEEAKNSKFIKDKTDELAIKEKEIRDKIATVIVAISDQQKSIESIDIDFNKFSQYFAKITENENSSFANTINNLKVKKEEINNKISALGVEIEDISVNKIAEVKNSLVSEKEKAVEAHKEKINEIREQHRSDLTRQREDYELNCAQVEKDYELNVADLITNTNSTKNTIAKEKEKNRADFEEQKAKLEQMAVDLQNDQARQIADFEAKRQELYNSVDNAKKQYESEFEAYKNKVAELEEEHRADLEKLKIDQENKVKDLINTMQVIPNEKLAQVQKDYDASKLDNHAERIAEEKKAIENEFNELVESHNAIRLEAETICNDAIKAFDIKKAARDAAIASLNAEIEAKKNDIEQHNIRLQKDLDDIKAANEEEANNLAIQLAEQLEETKKAYKSKYEVVERQYDQEISILKKELETKRADYNKMIADVSLSKQEMETKYKAQCDEQVLKTKAVQEELDRVNKNNADQKAEWNRQLNIRKEEIDAENKRILDQYNKSIEEKRADYQNRLDAINEKIADIASLIQNNESEKQTKQNELDIFKEDKKNEMENIKSQTNIIIENLTYKSAQIAKAMAAYEKAHEIRVKISKKQIAELMSQLAELERIRPSIVREVVENCSNELVNKTNEFKEKIKLLEKSNKEILEKLDVRRNQTLEQIQLEINELVSGKTTALKSHEDDLDNIIKTYASMIRNEVNKQQQLNDELVEQRKLIAEAEEKYKLDMNNVNGNWNNDKVQLESDNRTNENNLINEMTPKFKEAATELLNDQNYNIQLGEDIKQISEEFNQIDSEITAEKEKLVDQYLSEIKEINEEFNKKQEEEKEKLKDIDVISDSILDLFKRN